jgi:hypothetical protein
MIEVDGIEIRVRVWTPSMRPEDRLVEISPAKK